IAMGEWRRFFRYPGTRRLQAFVSGGKTSIRSLWPAAGRCIGESLAFRVRRPGPLPASFHPGAQDEDGKETAGTEDTDASPEGTSESSPGHQSWVQIKTCQQSRQGRLKCERAGFQPSLAGLAIS